MASDPKKEHAPSIEVVKAEIRLVKSVCLTILAIMAADKRWQSKDVSMLLQSSFLENSQKVDGA